MQPTANTTARNHRIITVCLATACAGLGLYAVTLRSDLAGLRGELLGARLELDGARKGEEAARGRLIPLQENVARLTTERDQLRKGSVAPQPEPAQVPAPVNAHPMEALAQTFATPEVQQMVRREALTDARKGFADVLKKWNLPPAETDQFLQFVADRDSADASDALAMLASGKLDEKSIAEQESKQDAARKENNARLKALLGDQRFAEFEAADALATERKAISAYRDHLESAGVPLTSEQRSALARIVTKEKPDENDWHPEDVEFFTQGMTDAQMLKMRQRQEAVQARITQQATGFLSPDQVAALQAAFRSEVEEQDLALKMARTIFQSAAPTAK